MSRKVFFIVSGFIISIALVPAQAVNVKQELATLPQLQQTQLEHWGLKDIDIQKSKKLLQNKKKVVVAIIDTGTDVNHTALKQNIWVNKNEIPNNGIDDDKNGFIDDTHGWNFVENNNIVDDRHGHGTHISGIVNSVADNVELMIVKYYDPKSLSDKNLVNTVKSIDYAIKNGANIINYSGGGFGANPEEEKAVQRALNKGIIFVAAAGNDTENSDARPFFPASYDLENIISVASLTKDSNLVESSNYGKETVDIAAPGENILSTLPHGRYGKMTGTSQATAFVTGALAVVMGEQPKTMMTRYIEQIVNTGRSNGALYGKTKYQTNLNTYRALVMKGAGVNANGDMIENTKLINADIFSSDTAALEESVNQVVENQKVKQLRVPAQMPN